MTGNSYGEVFYTVYSFKSARHLQQRPSDDKFGESNPVVACSVPTSGCLAVFGYLFPFRREPSISNVDNP